MTACEIMNLVSFIAMSAVALVFEALWLRERSEKKRLFDKVAVLEEESRAKEQLITALEAKDSAAAQLIDTLEKINDALSNENTNLRALCEKTDEVSELWAERELSFPERAKSNSGLAKLAEMIKAYRREHGLTLREFAALCKTSHSYISMLERGKNSKTGEPMSPTVATLKRIAITINIPFIELVTMIGNVKIPNFKEEP